jgi:hypothetical protein
MELLLVWLVAMVARQHLKQYRPAALEPASVEQCSNRRASQLEAVVPNTLFLVANPSMPQRPQSALKL